MKRKSPWNPFNYKYVEIAKSVWAFILPGVLIVAKALIDSTPLDWRLFLSAFVAAITTGGVVFSVKNQQDNVPPDPQVPVVNEPVGEGGFSVVGLLGVILLVVGILGLLGVIALGNAISIVLILIGLVILLLGYRDVV